MSQVPFIKMHGLGNDFVIIDRRAFFCDFTSEVIKKICDRRTGIGCDQFVIIDSSEEHDCFVRFYNADGSESGACGNATRCVGLLELSRTGKEEVTLETIHKVLRCEQAESGLVTVHMGEPLLMWEEIPLKHQADTLELSELEDIGYGAPVAVNVGNPHCVFFVKDTAEISIEDVGPKVENHPLFPERTNVEFAHILSDGEIDLRVWERGAGETRACGTGACAVAVASFRRGYTSNQVVIHLPGGDLFITIKDDGEILMNGAVDISFTGVFQLESYQS